jgi:selenide, water dikinase
VPQIIDGLAEYVAAKSIPGGTHRNWDSYGHKVGPVSDLQKAILADPQTSGGLLIAVEATAVAEVQELLRQQGLERFAGPIGQLQTQGAFCIEVLEENS